MRHVLFVDDQTEVLAGLRRMMHSVRSTCRATYVADADSALRVLDQTPVDVVVADMRMPAMDGATLLGVVRARVPDAVRIVLSGYSDPDASLRSVTVAHRFLSKPCDPAMLRGIVTTACDLQGRLSSPELRRLVGALGALPSPPQSFSAITEALGQPNVDVDAIVDLVQHDAGCSAKLLQLVNSAFFGLGGTVTRVADAVGYLGVSRLRDVVLASEVGQMLRCPSQPVAELASAINNHSLAVARMAQQYVPAQLAPDAFVAGVLHDVGRLTLAAVLPEVYLEIDRRSRCGEDLTALERERFGAGHAEVGAYLLRLWGLPLTLIDAIARHHDRDVGNGGPLAVAVARAAAEIGKSAAVGEHPVPGVRETEDSCA